MPMPIPPMVNKGKGGEKGGVCMCVSLTYLVVVPMGSHCVRVLVTILLRWDVVPSNKGTRPGGGGTAQPSHLRLAICGMVRASWPLADEGDMEALDPGSRRDLRKDVAARDPSPPRDNFPFSRSGGFFSSFFFFF